MPSLYPSIIQLGSDAPESCVLAHVGVSFDLESQRPDDLDILLVNPQGNRTIAISDAGGDKAVGGVNYTFTINGAVFPDAAAPPSGTYLPGQYPGLTTTEPNGFDNFPDVSGLASYDANFGNVYSFPSGAWKLYVVDDETGNVSSLPNGWTLRFTFLCNGPPMMCTPTPTPSPISTPTPSPSPVCQPGVLDTAFGGDGVVTTGIQGGVDVANAMVIQPDGRIVSAGFTCAEPDGNCSFSGARLDFALTRHLQDGGLDGSFGAGGVVTTDLRTADRANALALQPDGKIVAAGYGADSDGNRFALARYNSDGTLDNSFGTGGKVLTAFPGSTGSIAYSVAIQPDGRIVAGGTTNGAERAFALARYNGDGTLDTSFGNGGLVTTRIENRDSYGLGMALQLDGRIVAVGSVLRSVGSEDVAFAAARYNADGTLDASFGNGGTVITPIGPVADAAESVALQADGRIVAGGVSFVGTTNIDFALVRYHQDGTLDTSFGNGGKVTTAIAAGNGQDLLHEIAIQPDGRIVAVGDSASEISLARYDPNGTLDTTLNGTGLITTDLEPNFSGANAVAFQSDGKIVAAGYGFGETTYDFALVRYGAPCATPTPTPSPSPSPATAFDYDGDHKADISVRRPSGRWYILRSTGGFSQTGPLWMIGNRIVPADYDGDRRTDLGEYRQSDGSWLWISSQTTFDQFHRLGSVADVPVPADYDGDGRADVGVFTPSTGVWSRINSSNGAYAGISFGTDGDWPTLGDFDGDRRADIAVFRPSNGIWYRLNSSNGSFAAVQFGMNGDKVVPADYDGDGLADIAIWRPSDGVWHIWRSMLGYYGLQFGLPDDIPAPADYDGDGRADLTVFRPSSGIWYRLNSSNGSLVAHQWGQNGDIPTAAAYAN